MNLLEHGRVPARTPRCARRDGRGGRPHTSCEHLPMPTGMGATSAELVECQEYGSGEFRASRLRRASRECPYPAYQVCQASSRCRGWCRAVEEGAADAGLWAARVQGVVRHRGWRRRRRPPLKLAGAPGPSRPAILRREKSGETSRPTEGRRLIQRLCQPPRRSRCLFPCQADP